ncbi:dihydropteroate synthase [Candidatus Peregrinibacteria bacterium RIFOXYA2_FULL_33_7]|nr:MAG: dihydropteroate synthase [Candidatus Peregrinibacteria bacterium RIFOXYA2_FULL_33_7]
MGILNLTPDSFSDGGMFVDREKALNRAKQMVSEGAKIIDVGGESTGPGSEDVSEEEELLRIYEVLERISFWRKKEDKDFLISVDTYKPFVARELIKLGIDIINDVTAFRFKNGEMAEVVARNCLGVVLMYSKDETARTTRKEIEYDDVVKTIKDFWLDRVDFALKSGVSKRQIILDPGMGAFVSAVPKYSFEILERLRELKELGYPILVGTSRKSFLGGKIEEREEKSRETSFLAIRNGADIVRVHEVSMGK